jgi:hypothetical protein
MFTRACSHDSRRLGAALLGWAVQVLLRAQHVQAAQAAADAQGGHRRHGGGGARTVHAAPRALRLVGGQALQHGARRLCEERDGAVLPAPLLRAAAAARAHQPRPLLGCRQQPRPRRHGFQRDTTPPRARAHARARARAPTCAPCALPAAHAMPLTHCLCVACLRSSTRSSSLRPTTAATTCTSLPTRACRARAPSTCAPSPRPPTSARATAWAGRCTVSGPT